jgi:NADPH:quinone reductase-like Zn-dependent oxidoreductase
MANKKTDEMLPSFQKAIIQAASPPGSLQLCLDRPVPNPSPRQVLVKIAAVALNPCDWKMPARVPCPGASDGSDFSGTVVQVGEHVTAWKIGDRVAGAMHGSNPIDMSSGAFTEYIVTDTDLLWKVPDFVSWEEAAAVGWAVVGSVLIALFRALNLSGLPEEPTQKPEYTLLYGGSTASGTLATQLLKL